MGLWMGRFGEGGREGGREGGGKRKRKRMGGGGELWVWIFEGGEGVERGEVMDGLLWKRCVGFQFATFLKEIVGFGA